MNGRELNNRIEYMVTCVGDFAAQYMMSPAEAYVFLDRYRGLKFLEDSYDVEHTQSVQAAVEDMAEVCVRHGGVLA